MDTRSRIGRVCVTLAAMIALSAVMLRTPAFAADLTAGKMAGQETCASCHAETAAAFPKTFHGRKALSSKKLVNSCESCHGAGGEHADGGGDVSKIINPKKLGVTAANDMCLSCHKDGALMMWKTGAHATNDVSCLTCHSVHGGEGRKSLTKGGTDTCLTCHTKQKADIRLASHHPIIEGKMTCVSCHNPHGGIDGNIKADSVQELCAKCHSEKVGPFANEHPPVSDSCLNCHKPHGSANERLMKQPQQMLCMGCHKRQHGSATFTTAQATALKRDRCIDCHHDIHGSNQSKSFAQ